MGQIVIFNPDYFSVLLFLNKTPNLYQFSDMGHQFVAFVILVYEVLVFIQGRYGERNDVALLIPVHRNDNAAYGDEIIGSTVRYAPSRCFFLAAIGFHGLKTWQ